MKLNKQTTGSGSHLPSNVLGNLKPQETPARQKPLAVCQLDEALKLISFNSAVVELFNISEPENSSISEQLRKIFTDGERMDDIDVEDKRRRLRNGESINSEYQITTNKETKTIYLTVSPFFLDKEIRGYTVVFQDVSLVRQLEEENKKKQTQLALLDKIISNTSDAIFRVDKNNVVRFWNVGSEKMFLTDYSEAINQRVWDLFSLNLSDPKHRKTFTLFERSEELVKELSICRKDGQNLTIEISSTRLLDSEGAYDGFLAVCRDLTSVRRKQQQLSSLNRSLTERITANEESLFNADQRLNYHLNNTPLAIIEWSGLAITQWSQRAEELFGWTAEEAIGKTAEDLKMVFEDDEDVLKVRRQVFESNTRFERSINHNRTKWGKSIYCEWYSSVLRDNSGNITSVLTYVQDITARILAERKLEEKERQLELIYDTVTDVLYMYDVTPEGFRFASVNNMFLSVTGLQWDQVVGRLVNEVIPQPSLGLVLSKYNEAIKERKTVQWEEVTPYPTGLKTGIVSITPVFDTSGHCIQLVGSVHDITARKNAELELAESENRLKTILDTEPECIKLIGHDGRVQQMNPAGLAMVEANSIDQVVGKEVAHLVNAEHRTAFIDLTKKVLNGGNGQLAFEITSFKGTKRWLETHAVPLRDARNNITAALSVTRDITLQKGKDEQLKELNAQLRQLADHLQQVREEERISIAREIHDELGQLLTAIKIDLYWVKTNFDKDKKTAVQKLNASVALIDSTIDTIRRIVSDLHPVLLQDLGLVEALRWYIYQYNSKSNLSVSFTTSMEDVKPSGKTSLALFRICQESLTNIQRHAKATKVHIELMKQEGNFRLTITDNGAGFDKSKLGDKRTFGLLGMSERTIMCGGHLNIQSAEGKGTTIVVTVPTTSESHEQTT